VPSLQEHYGAILNSISGVLWEADAKAHRFTIVSPEAERLLGYPLQSWFSQNFWLEHISSLDKKRVLRVCAQAHQQQKDYELEYRMVAADGRLVWVRETATILVQPDQSLKLRGLLADITAQKQPVDQPPLQSVSKLSAKSPLIEDIVYQIRQSLDLKQVLTTAVDQLRQVLDTDRVVVLRFRPSWSGMVLVESVKPEWQPIGGKIFHDPCFADHFVSLYQQGRTCAISDVASADIPGCYQDLLQDLQVSALLVAPILQESNLWGLVIVHHCQQPRSWQPSEIDLLKHLAAHLGVAINHAEQYQQSQRQTVDLERQVQSRGAELEMASEFEATLKRITDRVRDSLDENQILQNAIKELALAIGVVGCNAALYDLENRTSKVSYEYTNSLMPLQGRIVNMDNFPEGYQQLLQGMYFQFCSLVPSPVRGHVSMFACPILDDQGVLGDLWLVSQKYRAFNEHDIRLVQQVANQCAIAIRQARLYQKAQAQVEELERLNRLKDDFLSTVSHELRTPMSNIKLATQMLEINLRQMELLNNASSGLSRYFHILKQECQREISLINDLLDLSRLETGEGPLTWQTIDLSAWLPRLAQPFLERAHSQNQILQVDVSDDLPPITTDLSHLERIMTELLSNACKYTPDGQVIRVSALLAPSSDSPIPPSSELNRTPLHSTNGHLTSTALIADSTLPMRLSNPATDAGISAAHSVQICVSNSGVEISPKELIRIFDKFYRIPNHDPWKHGGTGLGLALVKKLVEPLDGKIWADSQGGITRFTVDLPFKTDPIAAKTLQDVRR
jgi:PAS domain S-box-containing protein